MTRKKNYRRIIKRRLFWQKHGNTISIICMIGIAVLALVLAYAWRAYVDGKVQGNDQAGSVNVNGQEGTIAGEGQYELQAGNGFSESLCQKEPSAIPAYAGEDYVVLNGGIPEFNLYDLNNVSGESYAELDSLGRCGAAMAMLHRSMMPTGDREDIGGIKPTGWVQKKYDGIIDSKPPYLYNRCHLIAFALTGQNGNERNLITGTRHFNVDAMLPWEIKVMEYLEKSENHVLYRVTPLFLGQEALARGVEMEAWSVEDNGRGVCFHVFVHNVQPGVEIDYLTGESQAAQ